MTIIEQLGRSGVRRTGSPRNGFRYRDARGRSIRGAERDRIVALRIPPAWKDVSIHPSPSASVQAIGRDARGRWQYLYHPKQVARRERDKLERLLRFLRALPRLRRRVKRDLAQDEISHDRVVAGIVQILASCFLRAGGAAYANENGSFGVATLRPRHVTVRGAVIRFDFVGKSSRRHVREMRNAQVARLVRELLRYRGEVFKFRREDGSMVDVKDRHINAYLRNRTGERFTAKDFRTWAGTLLAACALARMPPESRRTATTRRRTIAAALREVSEYLGNTPAVCRTSYVFPVLLSRYEAGRVVSHPLKGAPRNVRQIERCERALLSILKQAPGRRVRARAVN